jgi:hypothetical protein
VQSSGHDSRHLPLFRVFPVARPRAGSSRLGFAWVFCRTPQTLTPTGYSNVANAQGVTGTGIAVAVIDSGVHNMSEFQNRVIYSQSFVPNLPNLNLNCASGGAQVGVWYASTLTCRVAYHRTMYRLPPASCL